MASPTRWTWIWVNSASWWWTGRPGVLQLMGLQRVGHDWATELNWTESHLSSQKAQGCVSRPALPGRLLRAAVPDLHRHLPLLALLPHARVHRTSAWFPSIPSTGVGLGRHGDGTVWPPPGHTGSLWIIFFFCRGSDLQGSLCSLLRSSHILLRRKSWKCPAR